MRVCALAVLGAAGVACLAQAAGPVRTPPMVEAHRRFQVRRGGRSGEFGTPAQGEGLRAETLSGATWTAVGPAGVVTPSYGLVSGRITALAFDPADTTGNRLFVGTTGGGLWLTQTAAATSASAVQFTPLTDNLAAVAGVQEASLSVGAVTVQPGGTGVVLVGLGDPNDALDSYYGAGILRSGDGGKTWTLISQTTDLESGLGTRDAQFLGLGFSGFAWSTSNSQLVVAGVTAAWDGVVTGAVVPGKSLTGIYYSLDAGASWHLARITDGNGQDVQGPLDSFQPTAANGATAVVWNPVRQIFVAAVNGHGYYQSADGVTFTRMVNQPGTGLTAANCPTESGYPGAVSCPMMRGALAVNATTGDTFAWTVDANWQDQGIWQDQCGLSGNNCSTGTVQFGVGLSMAGVDSATGYGDATIWNGDYNLTLAAVPSGQDTLLYAGDNDVWKCSLAAGCVWRNTTNTTTCAAAQVGEYQHALAWTVANPLLVVVGNDSGLWRSTDGVAETGSVCAATDAAHFQNLNAGFSSLAEVESVAQAGGNSNTLLAGLGANGSAGVVNMGATPAAWSQVLSGEGGPVAIDPNSTVNNWFVNNTAGVGIENCLSTTLCTPAMFGTAPVVGEAQVGDDGLAMGYPAPFLLDAAQPKDVLVGTCRVWRGPASGAGWTAGNAISPMLDGIPGGVCNGNALIRSLGALSVTGGGEVVYAGMAGAADGGATIPGHIFSATISPVGVVSGWTDLSFGAVSGVTSIFNAQGYDVSAITVDPHDPSGNTVYVTVAGISQSGAAVRQVFRSTTGGVSVAGSASWQDITDNLPNSPANDVAVDPNDLNTVYVATDAGVYVTRQVASCGASNCWTALGVGLPLAPVTQLLVPPSAVGATALTAGTYGRGIWQIALASVGGAQTTATVTPTSLGFANTAVGQSSASQTVTVKATGSASLNITAVGFAGANPGDFTETDTCAGVSLKSAATCTVKVVFAPQMAGARGALLAVTANVAGGQLQVPVSGTGMAAGAITLQPTSLNFGTAATSTTTAAQTINIQNNGGATVTLTSEVVSAPFKKTTSTCGTTVPPGGSCLVTIAFLPTAVGAATGTLTVSDSAGTQSAGLTGTGVAPATDTLSSSSLSLPSTIVGAVSAPVTVTMTNAGGLPLTGIGTAVSGDFSVVDSCGGTLAAGATCSFAVTFAPTAVGSRTGSLIVSDQNRAQTVTLSGLGQSPPKISVSPASMALGSIEIGTASAPRGVTVTNAGLAVLGTPVFSVIGSGASAFSLTNNACTAPVSYNQSCTVQVVFTPQASGTLSATLTVSSSDATVAPVSILLSGVGLTPPAVLPGVAQIDFGSIAMAYSSEFYNVQITNTGQVAMNQPTFSLTGANPGDYVVANPTQVPACVGSLAPGGRCNVQVQFSPQALGVRTATLVITGSNAVPATATVSLTGTGVPLYNLRATPTQLSFTPTQVQSSSLPQAVSIQSQSRQKLLGISYTVTGPYQLAASPNACGNSLLAGAQCTLEVVFAPTAAGDQPGTITVSSTSAGVTPVVIALDGTGLAVYQPTVSPSQLTFGSAVVGTPQAGQTLTVSNGSGIVFGGLQISLTGNADFTVASNGCGATLAVGASCTVGIAFTAATTGNRSATLTVSSSTAQVTPTVVTMSGTGIPTGNLSASPATLSFGSATLNQMSAPQTVTLINPGQALSGIQFQVTGDYSLASSTCGTQIAANSTCTATLTFSPSQPGTRVGTLTVQSTNAGYVPLVVGLTGTGLPSAALVAVPNQLSFGQVLVGTNSVAQQLTLQNPGTGVLTGLVLRALQPFSAGTGSCSGSIPAGGSCVVPVLYSPTAGGVQSGVLTVGSSSLGVAPVLVSLTGTGMLPASLSLSSAGFTFGATTVGLKSGAQVVVVTNPGGYALGGLQAQVAGDFQISASSCTATLPAGGNCGLQIVFEPTVAGGRQGTLTVTSTTAGVQPASATLAGTGLTPPSLSVTPVQLSFPATFTSQVSPAQTVQVSNTGQTGIPDLSVAVPAGFGLVATGTTCGVSLAGGSNCTVAIQFAPTASGAIQGTMTVSSGLIAQLGGAQAAVALSGLGATAPALVPTPSTAVIFPVTGVGLTANPIQVVLTNPGTLTTLAGLSIAPDAPAAAAGFSIAASTCTATLGPGATCTVSVVLTPKAPGALAGNLVFNSSTVAKPVAVPLSGTGFDFLLQPSGLTSVPVVSGQTAYFTVTLTPEGAASGTFTFQCGPLPAHAFCLFNPAQQSSLPANVQGNVLMGVATAGTSSAQVEKLGKEYRGRTALAFGGILGSVVLIPLCRKSRVLRFLGMVCLGLALSAGLGSCAGSGGQDGTGGQGYRGGTTPPGKYTVSMTATASGVSHTQSVTVVVN